jgi:hypothetical protein
MQITLSQDTLILIRMIEGQKRTIQKAHDRGEPTDFMNGLVFVLRDMQSELADVVTKSVGRRSE